MAKQPRLPQYQIRKGPDFAGLATQAASAGVLAIQNAAKKAEKQKAFIDKLNKEADSVEANFRNIANEQEKSSVVEMDAANRAWVGETAGELNDLYMKAYGSSGTKEDREKYKTFQAEAMEYLNVQGSYANLVNMDQQALSKNKNASNVGSYVGSLTPGSQYGSNAESYQTASQMKGQATNYKVARNSAGHLVMQYDLRDATTGKIMQDSTETIDMTARVAEFNKTKTNLDYYTITEEDNLVTTQPTIFESRYKKTGLLNAKGVTEIVQKYDKVNKKHIKTKVVSKEGFEEALKDPVNGPKLESALNTDMNQSNFFKKFYQLKESGFGNDGVGKSLPFSEMPWGFAKSFSDEEMKEIVTKTPTIAATQDLNNDNVVDLADTRIKLDGEQKKSGQNMLVNYYASLSPEGEEELSRTDRFEYEKDSKDPNKYSQGTINKFNNRRKTYNYITQELWKDPSDHNKGAKISNMSQYAAFMNKIERDKSGASGVQKVEYKTGAELNSLNIGTNNDPNMLYKVTMGQQNAIKNTYPTNFTEDDLANPEDLYQTVLSSYEIDYETQDYLNKPIGQ